MTEVLLGSLSGPARLLPVPATSTSRLLYSRGAVVMGWAFVESTGAGTARVNLYSGVDTTGTLAVPISLLADQSTRDYLSPAGVYFPSGVYLEVVSGSVVGSVWVIDT